ncbi:MAG: outer membrane protein transport protein [Microscillaceae bacterium]|nr:outer membrane protein transport protein [Microscillaceae bacterium]MDW8459879.1 outer membrane protein transport protein [Cytophagales bacterium]
MTQNYFGDKRLQNIRFNHQSFLPNDKKELISDLLSKKFDRKFIIFEKNYVLIKFLFASMRIFVNHFLIFSLFSNLLLAQVKPAGYFREALRFSQLLPSGTARMQGLAGAGTALGGDASHTQLNPAGVGFFRRSEFSFSPSLMFVQNQGDYLGEKRIDSYVAPNISQIAMIFATPKNDGKPEEKWKANNVGISIIRNNFFQENFKYKGINTQNSLTDALTDEAEGIPASDLSVPLDAIFTRQELAFQTYLINPYDNDNKRYFTWVRDAQNQLVAPIQQTGHVRTKGSQNQITLTQAWNYNDQLYLGLSIGVHTLRYFTRHQYNEEVLYRPNQLKDLIRFTLTDELEMRGAGFSLATGLIIRPNDAFRLGLQMQTFTWYTLKESYSTEITSELANLFINGRQINITQAAIVPGEYTFNVRTPWRANIGLAILAGKNGFINLDVEYVDYASARLSGSDKALFEAENQEIHRLYRDVFNLRAGGEFRRNWLRLRAGVAWADSPFALPQEVNRQTLMFSTGLGLRTDDMYVDWAVIYRSQKGIFAPYSLHEGTEPINKMQTLFIHSVLTLGFIF